MDSFISLIRWVHIGAGFTAFFVAPVAMIVRKGGKAHRQWGKIYLYAMSVATIAALIVSAYRPNYFLLGLSVFSFHLAFSGYRILFRKRPEKVSATALDWSVTIATLCCGILLITLGIVKASGPWLILFIVFGIGICSNAITAIKIHVSKKRDKNEWFFDHMRGMLASYIAAMTAFSAVNFSFLPIVVQWLWPTAIGAPLIAVWITKYKRAFAKGKAPKDVAELSPQDA